MATIRRSDGMRVSAEVGAAWCWCLELALWRCVGLELLAPAERLRGLPGVVAPADRLCYKLLGSLVARFGRYRDRLCL